MLVRTSESEQNSSTFKSNSLNLNIAKKREELSSKVVWLGMSLAGTLVLATILMLSLHRINPNNNNEPTPTSQKIKEEAFSKEKPSNKLSSDIISSSNAEPLKREFLLTDNKAGYDILLKECNLDSSNKLTCKFLIFNNQENRKVYFRPTSSKMIDGNGNAILGNEGRLGAGSGTGGFYEDIPNQVSVNGDVVFEALPEGDIKYIKLDFYNFIAEYRF